MKTVPLHTPNSSQGTCIQRNCISESRTHKVANIIAIIFGILILAAGLACSVLFGAELGMLYTMVVLGASVAVGILLVSLGASCLTCRSLTSNTIRIEKKDEPKRRYIDDAQISNLKQNIVSTSGGIDQARKNLDKVIEDYNQAKSEYKELVKKRDDANKEMGDASKKYAKARTKLATVSEKIKQQTLLDADLSRRSGITSSKVWESLQRDVTACKNDLEAAEAAYQGAVSAFEAANQAVIEKEKSLEVQLLVPAYTILQDLLTKQVRDCTNLIDSLEEKILDLQTRILDLTNQEVELRARIRELEAKNAADEAAKDELEKALAELRQSKDDLQKELEAKIAQLVQEKIEVSEQLNDEIRKLKEDRARCVLEGKVDELEKEIRTWREDVDSKIKEIEELREALRNANAKSEQERSALQAEIEKLIAQQRQANQKILQLTEISNQVNIVNDRNKILQQQLKEAQEKNKQEAILHKQHLDSLKQLHSQEKDEIKAQYEKKLNDLKKTLQEEKTQLETDKADFVRKYNVANNELEQKNKELNTQEQEIIRLKNTLVLYQAMVSSYEEKITKLKSSELEKFKKDKLTLQNVTEGSIHYTKADVSGFQKILTQTQLDSAQKEIVELKAKIENLEGDLKVARDHSDLTKALIQSEKEVEKLKATCQLMKSSLPAEDQKKIQDILDGKN
ncbi:chromosome segregation protein SMC,IncA protein [Chlamydia poikilotherma]|uniref:Chromosome segregation protein SMC,IncA protein n=1 Tax=Chlamydia poikilotherma TaxID=1967783 RepID=A0A3B0Q8Q3_9CHLA|nr:hypothetical protein [Chlamydia poikilotherma]SYX09257.1 chromosome segregation protein SMC,IncA protein [Chlamydia poikilotherma]